MRSAEERDYGPLCLIEQGTGCRYQAAVFVRQMMTISPETVLVAQEGDRIVGSLIALCRSDSPAESWILRVRVNDGCRRQGFGSSLMNRLLCILSERGVRHLRLTVSPANTGAVSFYLSHSFLVQDDIDGYFGDGERRYVMYRDIR